MQSKFLEGKTSPLNSFNSSNSSVSGLYTELPPTIDSLFPAQMSLRSLKRTAVASILLQSRIESLASPAVLSILSDLLTKIILKVAIRLSALSLSYNISDPNIYNSSYLLFDLALVFSCGLDSVFECLTDDLIMLRPYIFDQLVEYINEQISKPPRVPSVPSIVQSIQCSKSSFGLMEDFSFVPSGFQISPRPYKPPKQRLAQLPSNNMNSV